MANKKILCRYRISKLYNPSVFDWIGIFRVIILNESDTQLVAQSVQLLVISDFVAFQPGFWSDSEAVTWMYVGSSWEDKKKRTDEYTAQNILFKHRYVPPVGRYLFGYYSREKSCLISLSNPFNVRL